MLAEFQGRARNLRALKHIHLNLPLTLEWGVITVIQQLSDFKRCDYKRIGQSCRRRELEAENLFHGATSLRRLSPPTSDQNTHKAVSDEKMTQEVQSKGGERTTFFFFLFFF